MPDRFVLDCSIVMAWCFEDESNSYAESILESLGQYEALAPAIWPLEVGNVLRVAQRKKRLNEASVMRFLSLLRGLPIIVEQESPLRMFQEIFFLAGEHDLSTYDASYLDLAMRNNLSLATLDKKLVETAKKIGVQAFDPT
ncbi:MAG: type II toxin-antitoxin system VapC family toxin [Deltaproteobacteria bacterium]|nr:type II toxin-antitoxin system VapC family toxin [Deltaproteobacteria bacterium]